MFISNLAAILAVVFNLYWIPRFGLLGAAYATLVVIVLTNVLKIALIYYHYNIHPYEWGTLKIVALVGVLYLLADVVHIDLSPVWSILVRSLGIGILFNGSAYVWGFMEDIKKAAKNYLAR
ncbi:MAG: polysaccharide biosynthesis C-terminal domain-containing protein [Flavobacteriaceae bacterium]